MDDYDEPYSSPACDLGDIILEGSDTEQSPEEILAKRARYQAQAERCRNGKIPFIMSASMQGPFDRASGWENPWRHRPRKAPEPTKEDDWWKPGSEDMMFTRKNVLKRAADHGLGWMTPSAALEWCKAAASAEVEAGGDKTGYLEMDFNPESGSPGKSSTRIAPSTGANEKSLKAISTINWLPTTASAQSRQAYSTHEQTSTGRNEQARQVEMFMDPKASAIDTPLSKDSYTRGTKRPQDTKWLKSSYISKRGRWDDGPPIPSPTPLPPGLGQQGTALKTKLPSPIHAFQSLHRGASTSQRRPSLQPQKTKERDGSKNAKVSGKQFSGSSNQGRIEDKLLSTKSGHTSSNNTHHKVQAVEEPQDSFSAMSFYYDSIARSGASGNRSNIVVVESPVKKSINLKQDIPEEQNSEVSSFLKLPKPATTSSSHATPMGDSLLVDDSSSPEGVSFVTEVVPSCRDLEKFQFRKKRILQPNTDASGLAFSGSKTNLKSLSEPRRTAGSGAKIPFPTEMLDKDDRDEAEEDDWETTIGRIDHADRLSHSQVEVSTSTRSRNRASFNHASSGRSLDFDEDDGNEEWETTVGNQDPTPSSHVEIEDNDGNEDWETTMEGVHPSSTKVGSVVKSSNKEPRLALKESITPLKSQYSSSSWDLVDDIATSSFRRAVVNPPGYSHAPKSPPSGGQKEPSVLMPVLTGEITSVNETKSPKIVSSRATSRRSSSIINKSPRRSLDKIRSPAQRSEEISPLKATHMKSLNMDEMIDQNDISTQSANTTPTRSLRVPMSSGSQQDVSSNLGIVLAGRSASREHDIREEEAVSLNVTIIYNRQLSQAEVRLEDVDEVPISQMQLSLSQNNGSTGSRMSASSWSHGNRGYFEQEENGDVARTPTASLLSQDSDGLVATPRKATSIELVHVSLVEEADRRNTSPHSLDTSIPTTSGIVVETTRQSLTTPKTPHDSWRPSDLQTPWADDIALPPLTLAVATVSIESQTATMYRHNEPGETDWEQFERSLLAQHDKITPLKAFITPLRSPVLMPGEGKTGDPEEDTTINPWTSSMRKTGSKKTRKRVSFGFDLAEEETESFRPPSPIMEYALQGNTNSQSDPDPLDDGHPPPRPISMHTNSAAATQRKFKRILPDKTASQLNSSPAPLEAMAEAFIVADQEAPLRRRPSTPLHSRTHSPQMHRSSPWNGHTNNKMGFLDVNTIHDRSPVNDYMKDFDIAGAIGDANAFLEDWSVEADLKRFRELEDKGHESNGKKRRRLFGIV